jgi:hypothetical protein
MDNRQRIGFDPFITFKEDTHQYFGQDGFQYTPVSNVLRTFKESFDSAKVSLAMSGGDINAQQELLEQWNDKREIASRYGNLIHKPMENFFRIGEIEPGFESIIDDVSSIMQPYDKVFPEFQFYSKFHKICGTSDIPFTRRTRRIEGTTYDILDIGDYKTNASNGIRYSSSYWKDGKWKHGNYMLGPLSHLEDCEYNVDAMQLSLYARMAEMEYLVIIGRLFILYIGLNGRVEHIPVPYLRYEADAVLNAYASLKKI